MDTKILVIALASLSIGFFGATLLINDTDKSAEHVMHSTMQGMMAGLQGKTGEAFDKAFIEEMIIHHEGAVAMAEAARTQSNRAEIKKLAEEIISAQTREIGMMRGWLREWFGE